MLNSFFYIEVNYLLFYNEGDKKNAKKGDGTVYDSVIIRFVELNSAIYFYLIPQKNFVR